MFRVMVKVKRLNFKANLESIQITLEFHMSRASELVLRFGAWVRVRVRVS